MPRFRLWAVLAIYGLGTVALAQVHGSWSSDFTVLPNLGLDSIHITLGYTFAGSLEIYGTADFDQTGYVKQVLGLKGHLGPLGLEGAMEFAPQDVVLKTTPYAADGEPASTQTPPAVIWEVPGPSYRSADLKASVCLFGADFELEIQHFFDHVLTFSYDDFGQSWSTTCYTNHKYLDVAFQREIDVPEATIVYYADAAKTTVLEEESVEGPFEVREDLSGFVPAAKTYLENHAASHAADIGAAAYEIQPPALEDLVFKLRVPTYMRYTFTTSVSPFRAVVHFDDVCTGIQFQDAVLSLVDFVPCCDIHVDADLLFNKCHGFEYLEFKLRNLLGLCCGIGLNLDIKFTADAKTVSLDFSSSFGTPCVTIYAEPIIMEGNQLLGITFYGFRIHCGFSECSYIESITALDVAALEELLDEDIFQGDEFEYVKASICGSSCCGGGYQFAISAYFQHSGSLFGLTRLGAEMEFDITSHFTVRLYSDSSPSLKIGWTFKF